MIVMDRQGDTKADDWPHHPMAMRADDRVLHWSFLKGNSFLRPHHETVPGYTGLPDTNSFGAFPVNC